MKKLIAVMAFAGVLSVPSVIFADAVWYGSLRGSVVFGGDKDGSSSSGGSRWGIKGSSEVSEGLTAIYKFESRITQSGDPNQSTDQLYAGLSGGFGSLTIGKFHNAAYLSGGIRDVGNAYGSGDVASKQGNTLSYGYSTDTFTLQADVIMNGGKDTGKSVDQAQFGLAVNIGDIGKVAVGYEKVEDEVGAISASDSEATPPVVFPEYGTDANVAKAWMANQDKFGYKASHISASFGLSSVTARVGFSVKDTNMTQVLVPKIAEENETVEPGTMEVLMNEDGDEAVVNKKKTTYLGFTGSIGDTGMDWRAFGRKVEGHNGKEMNPWAVGVGKALGGGAYTYIEHGNNDDGVDGTTKIALHIDF